MGQVPQKTQYYIKPMYLTQGLQLHHYPLSQPLQNGLYMYINNHNDVVTHIPTKLENLEMQNL